MKQKIINFIADCIAIALGGVIAFILYGTLFLS